MGCNFDYFPPADVYRKFSCSSHIMLLKLCLTDHFHLKRQMENILQVGDAIYCIAPYYKKTSSEAFRPTGKQWHSGRVCERCAVSTD